MVRMEDCMEEDDVKLSENCVYEPIWGSIWHFCGSIPEHKGSYWGEVLENGKCDNCHAQVPDEIKMMVRLNG